MKRTTASSICGVLSCVALAAQAQTERSGNADARMQLQVQQLTIERVALQSENSKLKQELEAAKQRLAEASAARSALENRVRVLAASANRGDASHQQSEEQLERARGQLQELVAKFRETAQTLRDVETDRAAVKTELASKERELSTCVDRNAALYNLNAEVLDRMENRGFWSAMIEREPFTRLKRVELENLIDDYKYRADELRIGQKRAGAAE